MEKKKKTVHLSFSVHKEDCKIISLGFKLSWQIICTVISSAIVHNTEYTAKQTVVDHILKQKHLT